jgi:hypothetical protein
LFLQWNDEANEENDVRVLTKRLVRFRLCPSNSCSSSKTDGCSNGYGSYVVDLNTFMNAYFEVTRKATENECAAYLQNNCECSDNGSGETCQYDCLADAGLESCADQNPYAEGEAQAEQFNPENYMGCVQYQYQAAEGEENVAYYIGPYCSANGGSVYLGFFNDDTCSSFTGTNGGSAEYLALTGEKLPYSAVSLIQPACVSCSDVSQDAAATDDAAAYQNPVVMDACESIYTAAGKCESKLPSGMVAEPNTNACNYIEGIKVLKNEGYIRVSKARKNAIATFFIVLFSCLAVGLAFYINILRKKLGTKDEPLL